MERAEVTHEWKKWFNKDLLDLLLLLLLLLQLICHSVAAVLTLVQTKQIRINIHKRSNTKNTVEIIQNSKCKYTYYQNTHTHT